MSSGRRTRGYSCTLSTPTTPPLPLTPTSRFPPPGTFAGGSLDMSRPIDEGRLPCKYAPAYQLQLASPCSFGETRLARCPASATLIVPRRHPSFAAQPPSRAHALHPIACAAATISGKGTLAASGTEDGAIRIYSIERVLKRREEKVQPVLCSISTHTARINDASFHPEGALFLSCSSVRCAPVALLERDALK